MLGTKVVSDELPEPPVGGAGPNTPGAGGAPARSSASRSSSRAARSLWSRQTPEKAQLTEHRKALSISTRTRMRLARYIPPAVLHDVLSTESAAARAGPQQRASVLFADVHAAADLEVGGATEYLVELLGDFYSAACQAVERQGGRVDRHSGDALIGVFGEAMVAEHAEAAAQAAKDVLQDTRAISERWSQLAGHEINVSAAVATGLGRLEIEEGDTEVSLAGDLVERAAALFEAAEPGQILVDDATRRRLGVTWATVQRETDVGDEVVFRLEGK